MKADLPSPPRVEYLRVRNYRALHDFALKDITPLTVLLGPNGSGKSTVFDVFAFLSECFTIGLRRAWSPRLGMKEIRTRGSDGPVSIELRYREKSGQSSITYILEVNEDKGGPFVQKEEMRWTSAPGGGRPTRFLFLESGQGFALLLNEDKQEATRREVILDSRDLLGVSALGQFADLPRFAALRRFISDWYLSYITAAGTRGLPEAGPQQRLSASGDNLANVVEYLSESHLENLKRAFDWMRKAVPRLRQIDPEPTGDGRMMLKLKDVPFPEPILARFASDGTLKLLAYLVVLYDPEPPLLVGIEEPENHLHPKLQPQLAEECDRASKRSQLFVTTHSPFFVNRLASNRFESSTEMSRATLSPEEPMTCRASGGLGDLWMEGYLPSGDPAIG